MAVGDSLTVVVQQRTKLTTHRVATDAATTKQQKNTQPTVTRNFEMTPEHMASDHVPT